MKLPIKHKFFMEIKKGNKHFEVRDAHITFVDEETGEKIQKAILTSGLGKKEKVLDLAGLKEEEVKDCIEDDDLIWFYWE